MTQSALTLRSLRSTAVEVPMKHVLGTSAAAIRAAPLLLLDLETEEGFTGHSYLFCYLRGAAPAMAAMVAEVERMVKGEHAAPHEMWEKLAKRFRLIGVQGVVRMAMSGFDVAYWDALARAAGKPLVEFLGGTRRPIRAYNSNGLGLMGLEALAKEAARRGRALDGEGLAWIEEPIRHDDYRGAARLARELTTPIQIGENFSQPHALEEAIAAKACDLVMPDLERIGGVTGWLRAAEISRDANIKMSSHLFPEVSAHLLAATATADWLEYVDWAAPLLKEPLRIVDGEAEIASRPGNGLEWDAKAVERYRIGIM